MKWITDLSVHLNELCVHMSRSKGLQMLVHNPTMLVNIHISKKKKVMGVREGYIIVLAAIEFLVVEVTYDFVTPCDFSQEVAFANFSVFTMSLPFESLSLFHFSLSRHIFGVRS